jgi:hypothetical protein
LRLLQSWAPRNLAFTFIRHLQKPRFLCYTSRHAQQTPSLLWRGISALHHHQLLSAPAAAWQGARSRSAAAGFGACAAALSPCGVVVRTGARCRPLRGLRFGVWKLTPDLRPGLLSVVPCGTCTAFVHLEKAGREVTLYASQSGETGAGAGTAAMAMEQLSPLRRG